MEILDYILCYFLNREKRLQLNLSKSQYVVRVESLVFG